MTIDSRQDSLEPGAPAAGFRERVEAACRLAAAVLGFDRPDLGDRRHRERRLSLAIDAGIAAYARLRLGDSAETYVVREWIKALARERLDLVTAGLERLDPAVRTELRRRVVAQLSPAPDADGGPAPSRWLDPRSWTDLGCWLQAADLPTRDAALGLLTYLMSSQDEGLAAPS